MLIYLYIYTYTFYRNNPASFWSQEEVSHKAAAAATLKMLLSYYSDSPGGTFRVIMKYEVEKYRMGGGEGKKAGVMLSWNIFKFWKFLQKLKPLYTEAFLRLVCYLQKKKIIMCQTAAVACTLAFQRAALKQ